MSGYGPPYGGFGPPRGNMGPRPFGGPQGGPGPGFGGGPGGMPQGRFGGGPGPGPGGPMGGMPRLNQGGPPGGMPRMGRMMGGAPPLRMPPRPGGMMPGGMMPAGAGSMPYMAGAGPKPQQDITQSKSTTIYVGKIAATLNDDVMTKLLDACGKVKQWKPVKDPSNDQPKGFGFVEYEDAEGVLRALRLLNGVKIDGQELLLKSNSATQKYLEAYEQHRDQLRRQKQQQKQAQANAGAAEEKKEGEEEMDEAALDEANDNAALEIIMSIASEREAAAAARNARDEAVNDILSGAGLRPGESLPPPPSAERQQSAASSDRDRDRLRDRDMRDVRDGRGRHREDDRDADLQDRERMLEIEFEKERERQRRDEAARRREEERVYLMALQRWEMHEREFLGRREREKDRLKDIDRERQRQIKRDLEAIDTDDELEPWERPMLSRSRRMEERRKRRQREQEEDKLDREAELKERRAAGYVDEDEEERDVKRFKQEQNEVDVKLEVKEEADPIMQAMLEAAKNPTSTPPHAMLPGAASPVTPPEDSKPFQPAAGAAAVPGPIPAPAAAAVRSARGLAFGTRGKPVLNALFGEEEEEQTTKRKLVPIQYSEDELRAVVDHSAAVAAAAAGAAAAAAGGGSEQDSKQELRKIMDNIPVTSDGVYKYPIKWNHFNAASQARVAQWVGKKVKEMLGAEEPTLADFFVQLLARHTPAATMEQEAFQILEKDAAPFTLKLYRIVIHETEKNALGIKD